MNRTQGAASQYSVISVLSTTSVFSAKCRLYQRLLGHGRSLRLGAI